MPLKVIAIIYLVVIRNTIFSQPVNENNIISNSQQRTYEECCPCPQFLEDAVDQEVSPTDSLPRVPADDCQCLSSDADSLGSSSVFRPFLLRAAQSGERHRNPKQDVKPLLQPEVGLASSVLETLQKATDEEYEDALAREAARNAARNVPDVIDTATGNTRNSVTIVLNPREDLYVDDTIPEASRIHETRCIHGPLGKGHIVGSTRIPKEYLLQRKPLILSHKSYDMDNSASNIQERLYNNCNNNLNSKLKMNPLLLNKFTNNIDREFQDNSNPVSNFDHQLQRTSPRYFEDSNENNNDHLNNSPAVRLASLKNKLRDLSEIRNLRLLKNSLDIPRSNHVYNFNNKPGNSNVESKNLEANTKSPVDHFFDKQSPILKTILKLKDVELIPPIKTINNGLMRENTVDLKLAGTENNDCVFVTEDGNINEVTGKDDVMTNDNYSNKLTNMQEAKKGDSEEDDKIEDSCEIQSAESKDSYHEINKDTEQFQREEVILSQNIDSNIQGEKNNNFLKNDFQIESNEDVDNMQDSMPEMSNNILQKSSQGEDSTLNNNTNFVNINNNEEVYQRENFLKTEHNPTNLQRNLLQKNRINSNLLQRNNEDLLSFKEDMLRRLENLKKTIKSKLQEPENNITTQMVTSQYLLEKETDDTTDPEFLLEKEKALESESRYPLEAECKTPNNLKSSNEDYDMPTDELSGIQSLPKELDYSETQVHENLLLTKNNENNEGNDNKLQILQENNYLQDLKKVCRIISDDNFYMDTEKVISKDFLPLNEMSSQASTFALNAIRPANNNNNLKSSLQDIVSPISNTLQIPSLEDIRRGITDIIDAGEQEVGNFRTAISDSLNESSNYSPFVSAKTNLQSEIFKTRPLKNTLANSSANRHNIYPFKSKPLVAKTAPLKAITVKPLLSNKAGSRKNGLPLRSGNVKPSLKSPLDGFSLKDVPSLASLKEFLKNRSNVYPGIEIPSTNIDKISIFSPQIITSFADDIKYQSNNALKSNLQKAKDKNLFSKSNTESNGLLEAMDKRRENFNEKIESLHLDFNDRLASIHEKLLDQPNIQSVNIPKTDWYGKSPSLLGLSRDTQSQNVLPRKQYNIERNLPLGSNSLNLQERTNHNEITPTKLSLPNQSTNERKHHLRKQDSLTPLRSSNVKIMFSTTTRRPIVTPKLIKKPVLNPPARKPLNLKGEYNDANEGFNLKGVTKPYYSKYKSFGDTNKSPSQSIQTKIPFVNNFSDENEEETCSQMNLHEHRNWGTESLGQNQPVPYNSVSSSKNSGLPNTSESSILSNMRNALRARFENITKPPKSMKAQETMISDGTNSVTRVLLPENVKTSSAADSFLKENTSYKCNMICVKEP